MREPSSSWFRLATWGVGVLLLLVVVGVVMQQFGNVASLQHRTIDELITHLRTGGLSVGTPTEMSDTLGAERRVQVMIDDRQTDLLQFDMSDKAQEARVQQIRKDKTMLVDDISRPAVVNGRFVLVDQPGEPVNDKLVSSFTDFGTPDTPRIAEHEFPLYY
jgi:hypothetical protein